MQGVMQVPALKNDRFPPQLFEGRAEHEVLVTPCEAACRTSWRAAAILKWAIVSDCLQKMAWL